MSGFGCVNAGHNAVFELHIIRGYTPVGGLSGAIRRPARGVGSGARDRGRCGTWRANSIGFRMVVCCLCIVT